MPIPTAFGRVKRRDNALFAKYREYGSYSFSITHLFPFVNSFMNFFRGIRKIFMNIGGALTYIVSNAYYHVGATIVARVKEGNFAKNPKIMCKFGGRPMVSPTRKCLTALCYAQDRFLHSSNPAVILEGGFSRPKNLSGKK